MFLKKYNYIVMIILKYVLLSSPFFQLSYTPVFTSTIPWQRQKAGVFLRFHPDFPPFSTVFSS